MTKKDEWQERSARWFCIGLAVLAGYLLLRYAASVVIVFGIAWGVGAVVYPLSVRTARLCHLPRRLCAVIYVLLLLALLGGLLAYGLIRLGEETEELILRWESGENGIAGALERIWVRCAERLSRVPILGRLLDMLRSPSSEHVVGNVLSEMLRNSLDAVGASCSAAIGRMLRATPRFFVGVVITVMACFYLAADYGILRDRVLARCAPTVRTRIQTLRGRAGKAVRGYLRAYLLLFFLTFAEVLVGLWILRQPYALLIALCVAVVDLLPIFGAGAVLVPWSIVALVLGDYHFGLGLLILYGVMSIVRQIAEPHLIGSSLGVHPVFMLFALLVGWELFGVLGMLLAPAAALLVKELFGVSETDSS